MWEEIIPRAEEACVRRSDCSHCGLARCAQLIDRQTVAVPINDGHGEINSAVSPHKQYMAKLDNWQ